ncbi:MAG: protein of unknown function DUF354 [uncultured Thermoleophilia bacterium]|uniref:DUF354 domain-containing protein n=2 Tax=uncultured Thermoleophilia bacterium TaxID=1497501 RepID=A0A6J4TQK3_9ACTN|nr:MAG: protein of unknown function DUF354 [uncultured Thermoleophilia bacterium]
MRVWVDLTNAPHVPVLAPVVRALRARGDDVHVTARDFAQTVELARLHDLEVTVIGRHGGASRGGKARAAVARAVRLERWARRRRLDVALAHGSTDQPLVARLLGVRATTMFDYEYAVLQHTLNCRAARRVLVPDAIPPERLRRYGATGARLVRYPGLKEEYALADVEPDRAVLGGLGLADASPLAVLRPPPELALYHRFGNPLFEAVLRRLSGHGVARTVVLPRTAEQGDRLRALRLPRVTVPERAVDGQSLVGVADLVVSAGGTMNREAVVLGTPVWTTFGGRLGAVDEALVRQGRLRVLRDATDVAIRPRDGSTRARVRRDPAVLAALAVDP